MPEKGSQSDTEQTRKEGEEIDSVSGQTAESIRAFKPQFETTTKCLRNNFPWYDRLLVDCGYDETADPSKLPYINDDVLCEHYYNENQGFQDASAYFTSGTSRGIKRRILWSPEDHRHYVEQRLRIFSRFISGDCKKACADLGTGHAASSATEIFRMMGLECLDIDFTSPIDQHVDVLNRGQPDVLYTMPMILENIMRHPKLCFRPKKIIVVGYIASASWKKHVTDFFNLHREDLLDVYGSIEIGSIGYECFDCDSYHFDDHIIPEIVGGTQNGVLALTSLARSYFPAARFVTDDIVEGLEKHCCGGKSVFSFKRIVGREGNELKHGEKLSLYDVINAVETFLPGAIFQIIKGTRTLTLKIFSPSFTPEKAEAIRGDIRQHNPAVDQMIRSGLVDDLVVENVGENEQPPPKAKRVIYK